MPTPSASAETLRAETLRAETLRAEVVQLGLDAGFERVGFARAERLGPESARLDAWLRDGHHGSMAWMERNVDVRTDPRHEGMVPHATSVVVFATRYSQAALPQEVGVRIASYARGRDYHRVLEKRLRPIVAKLRASGFDARSAVDSKPVFERAWAVRAGLGFIGKNSCLIVPGLGSHLFLCAVVTTAAFVYDEAMTERCGTCTRCLDACPTRAFVAPRRLDARRCISYQTIENTDAPPENVRESTGDWAFGCDDCQDVCPFNHGQSGKGADVPLEHEFYQASRWQDLRAQDFLTMDEATFEARFAGNPLRRAGRAQMARNVVVALANKPGSAKRALPVLREVADTYDDSHVRDVAVWAIHKLERE